MRSHNALNVCWFGLPSILRAPWFSLGESHPSHACSLGGSIIPGTCCQQALRSCATPLYGFYYTQGMVRLPRAVLGCLQQEILTEVHKQQSQNSNPTPSNTQFILFYSTMLLPGFLHSEYVYMEIIHKGPI